MKSLYPYYMRSFTKFADHHLQICMFNNKITVFANVLTQKANELVIRGGLNDVDVVLLQKELFEKGKVYMNRFGTNHRHGDVKEIRKCGKL